MRKLTLSRQKSTPRADGNVLARLLTENSTCADCDAPLPGPTVSMDVRYGVFVCAHCASAHRLLSDALVKESSDALTADQLAFVSSMGNARANSLLEARLKQAVDVRKPRPDADGHHRSNYTHAKYEDLRYCANKADVSIFSEGITQSRGAAARASTDDIDYDHVVKSGFVMKKKMGKNWKKRYLLLTPHHLAYFADVESRGVQNAHRPLGTISLANTATKMTVLDDKEVVQIASPSGTFYFDGQDNNKSWLEQMELAQRNLRGGMANSGGGGGGGGVRSDDAMLSAVRHSTNAVLMEGTLKKQGNQKLIKDWKPRHFVLTEAGSLLYYGAKGEPQPLGVIPLARAQARPAAGEVSKEHAFAVDTGDRVFFMQAASTAEMERWVAAIEGLKQQGGGGDGDGRASLTSSSSSMAKMSSTVRLPAGSQELRHSDTGFDRGPLKVRRQGYLMKMGNNVRGKSDWKQRYFVLDADNLAYYAHMDSDEQLGSIKLITCSACSSDVREYCIQLTTPNRKYYVQAGSGDEMEGWLAAIADVKRDLASGGASASSASGGGGGGGGGGGASDDVERVMSGMLKKMGNNTIKDWRDRYCVMNSTCFRYYKSSSAPKPLGEVNLLMCNAKDEGSNRFALLLPSRKYVFEAKNAAEHQKWMQAIQDATTALYNNLKQGDSRKVGDGGAAGAAKYGDNKQRLLDLLATGAGNQECADCGKANPRWASVNLGVFVCLECSGIHRSLGTHISKVRSADLDEWEDDQFECLARKGNRLQNEVYEWKLRQGAARGVKKPTPDSSMAERDVYIRQKWDKLAFADPSRVPAQQTGGSGGGGGGNDLGASGSINVSPSGGAKAIYREGFLTKQGHKRKNWTKRWFVLRDAHLMYFVARGATEPKGRIFLGAEVTVRAIDGGLFPHLFKIITPDKVFSIFADTEKDRSEWIDLLERSVQRFRVGDEEDNGAATNANDLMAEAQVVLNGHRDKDGIMWKKGETSHAWVRRFFILTGADLYYFKPDTMEMNGVIAMRRTAIKVATSDERPNVFQVLGARLHWLSCETDAEMRKWMAALTEAASKTGRADVSKSIMLASPPDLSDGGARQGALAPAGGSGGGGGGGGGGGATSPRKMPVGAVNVMMLNGPGTPLKTALRPTPAAAMPQPPTRVPSGGGGAAPQQQSPRAAASSDVVTQVSPRAAAGPTAAPRPLPRAAVNSAGAGASFQNVPQLKAKDRASSPDVGRRSPVPGSSTPPKKPLPSSTPPKKPLPSAAAASPSKKSGGIDSAPPKRALPSPGAGGPPAKPAPTLQDSAPRVSFGTLNLAVPDDVTLSDDDDNDNPYSQYMQDMDALDDDNADADLDDVLKY